MALNITKEVAVMERMTPRELRDKYAQVFGEASRSGNKRWLIKRIAWRMQANEEGDLSERARRRAVELANDADLRLKAPPRKTASLESESRTVRGTIQAAHDSRVPLPGTILTRPYKGTTIRVTVLADGFEYQGELYRSLSAVAKAVTGKHWNGYHFFGLIKNGAKT